MGAERGTSSTLPPPRGRAAAAGRHHRWSAGWLADSASLVRMLPRNRIALTLIALVTALVAFSFAAFPPFLARMSDDGLRRGIGEAQPFERNIAVTQVSALPLRPNGAPVPPSQKCGIRVHYLREETLMITLGSSCDGHGGVVLASAQRCPTNRV